MGPLLTLGKRLLLENLPLKVVALVMAMILVVVAREETTRVVEVEVPVVVRSVPPDRILASPAPEKVQLRVRASVQRLSEILAYKKPYELDLSSTGLTQTIYFLPEEFELHLGGGVRVISVSPASYEAELDERQSKEVPVVLNLVREPGQHYSIDKEAIRLSPDRVMVTGGSKTLAGVQQVVTVPVDLSSVVSTYEADIALQRPEGLELRAAQVRVQVPVSERQASRIFQGVPMGVLNCPRGFSCQPTPSHYTAQVEGPQKLLDALTDEEVAKYAYVDGSRLAVQPDEPIRNFPAVEPTLVPPKGLSFRISGARFFNILVERR